MKEGGGALLRDLLGLFDRERNPSDIVNGTIVMECATCAWRGLVEGIVVPKIINILILILYHMILRSYYIEMIPILSGILNFILSRSYITT